MVDKELQRTKDICGVVLWEGVFKVQVVGKQRCQLYWQDILWNVLLSCSFTDQLYYMLGGREHSLLKI